MTTTTNPAPSTRTKIGESPTFLRSINSEWTKLRTLRSPWIATGVVAALSAGASGAAAFFIRREFESQTTDGDAFFSAINGVTFANYLGVIAIVIVGALIGSGDFQHKTANPTLISQPSRWRFLSAKACLTVVTSAVLALLLMAACLAAAYLFSPYLGTFDQNPSSVDEVLTKAPPTLLEALPMGVGHLVLAGLFGMGLGIATRSTTFAVSGFFILRFVEVAANNATTHWATNLLPFQAGDRLLPYQQNVADLERFESKPASAVIYLSFIALLFVVGAVRTYKEDVS